VNVAIVNLAAGQTHTMAPLGALYIVAALERAGIQVSFADYALERGPGLLSCDRIARFFATSAQGAALRGISCFAGMLPYAVEAGRRVREVRPNLPIVLGGPGSSATPTASLDAFPFIDFVVFGEGEETAVELVEALGRTQTGTARTVDRTDDELLERRAGARCRYIFFGVESGSARVLARVNKVVPFEHTCRAVQRGVVLGMYVHTPLMWGFSFEEMRDFQETLGFGRILEALGAHAFYTLATPLPATALCEEFRGRLQFDGAIYSTIIAPGPLTDLTDVQHLIERHPTIFTGFYHFADGRVREKIAAGRAAAVTLGDIRISNLVEGASTGAVPS
jgi:radical SAM superfamily enzyme YgiQ (UPF0313 family)